MDQCSAGASVAVGEGVEGLELGMGDGGLDERGVLVVVDVVEEVGQQVREVLVRWRNERRAARVERAPPDPVLLLPNDAAELGRR